MPRPDADFYESDGYINRSYLGSGTASSNKFLRGDHVWETIPSGTAAGSYNILAAGSQTAQTTGSVLFTNSNGITFGMSNSSVITASYTVPSTAGLLSAVNVSAGTTSNNLSALTFNNSNGISFGLSGSVITGTVQTNYLTTAMASNQGSDFVQATAAFAGTSASGTIASNGISVSIGPYLTTAALSNHSHGVSFTSGSTAFQTLSFTNSNGISFNSGTQGIFASHNALTTARASTDAIGLNTAQTNVTWTANSSGLSLNAAGYAGTGTSATNASITMNSNGLAISVAAPGAGGGFAAQGSGAYTQNTGTIQFANSNGITFGLSTNQMTASHNGLTTAAASNHSHGNPTLNLTNLSGTTASASNGFTLSLSAAAPGGGAAATVSVVEIADGGRLTTCAVWNNATYSNRPIFIPFEVDNNLAGCNSIRFFASRSTGTVLVATMFAGIYSRVNATSAALVSSTSHNISVSTSAQYSGIRVYDITGLGALSLSPGRYLLGLMGSCAASNSLPLHLMGGDQVAWAGYVLSGTNQTAATATNSHIIPMWGVYTANTAAMPANVVNTHISGGGSQNSPDIYAVIKAI